MHHYGRGNNVLLSQTLSETRFGEYLSLGMFFLSGLGYLHSTLTKEKKHSDQQMHVVCGEVCHLT